MLFLACVVTKIGFSACMFADNVWLKSNMFQRREWPNGEVKIMYIDGTIESRYRDGRVRIKDSQGCILRDEYVS